MSKRINLMEDRKSTRRKIIFFIGLLTFALVSYIKSGNIIDIGYFFAVLILFIRFLLLKLYY